MLPVRKRWRASVMQQRLARELRGNPTPAETELWRHLRGGQIEGLHFRRQHALGRYIVDFYCAEARLVIEVDGHSHGEREEYDERRSRWLSDQKDLQVFRCANSDVHANIRGVLERILELVRTAKSRPPP